MTNKIYPPNSVLSQIKMNIYADTNEKAVTILYDKALTKELLGLEYDVESRKLTFVFSSGNMPFGIPIEDDVSLVLEKVETVTLLQIDLKTKNPVFGLKVPLSLKRNNR
jgi:hypothetical protein